MDLNAAIAAAEQGAAVRDAANMREGWTVRWVEKEKLLYYFDPKGVQAHRIKFSDAMRASYRWDIVT